MEGDDNSGDEIETDQTTKSIVSAIRRPNEEKSPKSKEFSSERDRHSSQTHKKAEELNGMVKTNEENMEVGFRNSNGKNVNC